MRERNGHLATGGLQLVGMVWEMDLGLEKGVA